ncbi:CHAT domain-containing protein [Hypoxylon trugodes]|uniref:CHAT domain-containing protein n=1 Tax=Hypoxylon trugodes TaxID=326681 RepID=UPI00219F95E8|nr:CHAT domain-containing protein [Hypoxylon trugodes]KAI1387233.1 CHAT domain-containing protein [Hypoxylon trugodes]
MAAANTDPIVVINLDRHRCDAFIIESSRIRTLKLPDLSVKDVVGWVLYLWSFPNMNMTPMLEWLWTAVCRPCLDALGFSAPASSDTCPRVWWIPTGPLNQLPLHAAGFHSPGSTDTVIDRVMSSYASSIKALVHGRKPQLHNITKSTSNRALLVTMYTTPGLEADGILPFATEEVKVLTDLYLRDHKIQENQPFLGYLSACSTGSNRAINLADEAIHLIGALQLAGFRHVVGTLWKVSDEHCVDVARDLYKTTRRDERMTDIAVCRGLHRAFIKLRGRKINKMAWERDAELVEMEGFHWVPYVHFGV